MTEIMSLNLPSTHRAYLIIPAMNSGSCVIGIAHINDWAEKNNLGLNHAETKDIVFRAKGKRGHTAQVLPPCDNIERRHSSLSSMTN